ncbi:uncharacterized protein LOC121377909 [Gigantopelta aegis]|uniref:uncharacterized protein LOC121377909 n=1 Tax=Gigantopelta aegis TaxID=1735272 RepID=UPI001B88D429|nr:uncharacterized protein LOC121377909 [Gigantopelta aegis]
MRTEILLHQGSNAWDGFVQIKTQGRSGYVCPWQHSNSVYNDNLARLVCDTLGYYIRNGAGPTYSVEENSYIQYHQTYQYGYDSWMDNIACLGDELDIADCLSKKGLHYEKCDYAFKVVCPQPVKPNITAVRLVGGRFPWEGRVEVENWGYWGSVCHKSWTKQTAAVVCRMLGFHPKYVFAAGSTLYGSGNETAVLQQYSCHGNENNLNNCSLSSTKIGLHCQDGHTAGLRCVEFDVIDVIDVKCSQHSWLVAVNMTLLKAIYPTATPENISMGHIGGCKGTVFSDGLLFYHLLDDCYTSKKVLEEQTVYYNHLSYIDPNHHGVDSTVWKQHLECSVYHERTPAPNSTAYNKPIDVSFYSDPSYLHALPEGSLPTQIANRVYVRVSPEVATNMKMILKDCQVIETESGSHVLIKNGCEVNRSTHISLLSDVESRFSFSATWTQSPTHSAGRGHVTCDVKFCHIDDRSPSCYHGCRNPLDIPIIG